MGRTGNHRDSPDLPDNAEVAGSIPASPTRNFVLYPALDYGRFGLIVNPRGVSKWSGIEAFCTLHGIAPDEVAAVGHGQNDLDMLLRAGVRIGVRGGCDEVVEMAEFLIEPPEREGWPRDCWVHRRLT